MLLHSPFPSATENGCTVGLLQLLWAELCSCSLALQLPSTNTATIHVSQCSHLCISRHLFRMLTPITCFISFPHGNGCGLLERAARSSAAGPARWLQTLLITNSSKYWSFIYSQPKIRLSFICREIFNSVFWITLYKHLSLKLNRFLTVSFNSSFQSESDLEQNAPVLITPKPAVLWSDVTACKFPL